MSDTDVVPTGRVEAVADAAKRVWGFDVLRPLQEKAISAGVAGRDALVVLPTGGGKSLCYQVPPLVTGKATVVISPLIALMRDQVRGLELNGYRAAALHSGIEWEEAKEIERALETGELKLLLAAPERAVTRSFKALLARLCDTGQLGNIAIDEAHCISQWGHDFRPEYRRLAELRETLGSNWAGGVQAFTATATPRVRDDIAKQLNLQAPEVLVGRFDRANLTYRVITRKDAAAQAGDAIERMHAAGGGGAIVYCLSRKDTEELAEKLRARGVDARAYHAGLDDKQRGKVEAMFSTESLDVVVATVAFGMGIDRSNVRLVVHACMPKSVEAYQQETGRAGRDGEAAECLLLFKASDATRWEKLFHQSAMESGDADAVSAQIGLVREMRRFVSTMSCRHKMLSEHFGQVYEPPARSGGESDLDEDASPQVARGCGACDVCLGETEEVSDSTRISRILMSAVARLDQRYGAAHVADVVRGVTNERVSDRGHNTLSVFGLLQSWAKTDIVSFLDQLVGVGALERGEHQVLIFGARGIPVMKGDDTITLSKPVGGGRSAGVGWRERGGSVVEARPLDVDEKALFESLRNLRKSIADERGVPPYVVFSDATLRDMCRRKPENKGEFLSVKGVGKAKLKAFGEAFLEAIQSSH